jgi:hypothetical protein
VGANLSTLIPELQPFARDLVRAAGAAGLFPRITSTRRSYAEQTRLYNRYLAGQSEFPAAPPGRSAHEYGFAFDMIVSPLSALPDVGDYWKQLGGIWHPSDVVHFEYPGFSAPAVQEPINKAGWLDVIGTASGYIGLPFALISLIETAASEDAAKKIIDEWNFLTGSNVSYH